MLILSPDLLARSSDGGVRPMTLDADRRLCRDCAKAAGWHE